MLNTFLVFTQIFSWWKKLNKTKKMKWKIEFLKILNLLHISKLILIFLLFSYNDRIYPIITFHTIRKLFETHCERTVFAWYSLLWARHLLWCQNKWFVLTFLMWTATVTFHTWSRRKLNDFNELSLRKNDWRSFYIGMKTEYPCWFVMLRFWFSNNTCTMFDTCRVIGFHLLVKSSIFNAMIWLWMRTSCLRRLFGYFQEKKIQIYINIYSIEDPVTKMNW